MSLAERYGGEGNPRTATDTCKTTEAGQNLGDDTKKFIVNDDKGVTDESRGRWQGDGERPWTSCGIGTVPEDGKECSRA